MTRLERKILEELKTSYKVSRKHICLKYFIFPWQAQRIIRNLYNKGCMISVVKMYGTNYKLMRDENGVIYE